MRLRTRCLVSLLCLLGMPTALAAPPVTVTESADAMVLDNGMVALTLSRKSAQITGIIYRYDGQETPVGKRGEAMYFDYNGGPVDASGKVTNGYLRVSSYLRTIRLVHRGPDRAEVMLEGGPTAVFPFYNEVHYLLARGESGFYAWALYRHGADMPAASMGQTRFAIKGPPGTQLFTDHIVDDHRMGPFPTSPTVRAVMDATYLLEDGTVYTKYDNTAFMADHHLHGMAGHGVGLWMVTPSNEYVNGGPLKQELTVHMDNVVLCMLEGGHFGSGSIDLKAGEVWSKFYGPCFVYLNHGATTAAMYADAKRQAAAEAAKWPYRWAAGSDYPVERGSVAGALHLTDGKSARGAWVILGAPGGDWPQQGKAYLYWTRAGRDGRFDIGKVRPGRYTLYACGANQFEQFVRDNVEVKAGGVTRLGNLAWQPVKHGRTLWQIGVADRSTQEFRNGDDVRHWANYRRYPKDFPDDVIFTIGKSRESANWNFAQWTWYSRRPYWTIRFDLPRAGSGKATLTLGFASSQPVRGRVTNLQVKVNGHEVALLHLPKSGTAGYRSGGQDSAYRVKYVTFDAGLLHAGANEVTLGHLEAAPFPSAEEQMRGRVGQVMYDAIRLEVAP